MRRYAALLIMWVLACALAATTAAAPPVTTTVERAVDWGGQRFATPTEFAQWLHEHRLSYAVWARNHPYAAARLERRDRAEEETATFEAPASPRAATDSGATASVVAVSGRSPGALALMATLGALAASLLLLAALPVLRVRHVRVPSLVGEHQPELAGAGIAIGLALAAASLL